MQGDGGKYRRAFNPVHIPQLNSICFRASIVSPNVHGRSTNAPTGRGLQPNSHHHIQPLFPIMTIIYKNELALKNNDAPLPPFRTWVLLIASSCTVRVRYLGWYFVAVSSAPTDSAPCARQRRSSSSQLPSGCLTLQCGDL